MLIDLSVHSAHPQDESVVITGIGVVASIGRGREAVVALDRVAAALAEAR